MRGGLPRGETRPGSPIWATPIPYISTPPPRYPRSWSMLRPPLTALLILAAGLTADRAPQLRILRALPQGDAGPLAVVTVSFDRPIAASLEGVAVDPARILHIEPAVAGKAEWRDPVT